VGAVTLNPSSSSSYISSARGLTRTRPTSSLYGCTASRSTNDRLLLRDSGVVNRIVAEAFRGVYANASASRLEERGQLSIRSIIGTFGDQGAVALRRGRAPGRKTFFFSLEPERSRL
jgi:hypothetical protein